MTAQSNITGNVASWTNNQNLVSDGTTPLATFSFTMNAPSIPFLPGAAAGTLSRLAVAGMGSWTATLQMLVKAPQIGNNGAITFANGYVLNANAHDITLNNDVIPATDFSATVWRTFIPGAYGWGGSFGGFLDSVTPTSSVGAACSAAGGTAASFVYGLSGALPLRLSGNIIPETGGFTLADGTSNDYTYSFLGDGVLAAPASGGATIIGKTSAITASTGALVLSGGDGMRISGLAFPSSISVRTAAADMVVISVTAQGSGDPNIS